MKFRYSLRAALLAMLAICLILGWLNLQVTQDLLERHRVRQEFTNKGVGFYDQWDAAVESGPGIPRRAKDNETTPQRLLRGLFFIPKSPPAAFISFMEYKGELTDEKILRLRVYPEVQYLQLFRLDWQKNEAGATYKGVVTSPRVTDRALAILQEFPDLEQLDANGCNITDVGCDTLSKHNSLQHLSLEDTNITNEGLMRLANCPSIKHINVRRTGVKRKGVNAFEKVRPDVRVID